MTKKIFCAIAIGSLAIPLYASALTLNLAKPNIQLVPLTASSTASEPETSDSGNVNSGSLIPLSPGTINGLNPQPEPPKPVDLSPLEPGATTGLNPQPEPPMPVEGRLKPGEANGINPQPEPPVAILVKAQTASQVFSLVKKCIIDAKRGSAQIDDEITWNKCGDQYATLGAKMIIPALKKCVVAEFKNGATQIDDEVTWNKCAGLTNDLSPQPDPPGKFSINPINQLNPQPEPPLPGIKVSAMLNWAQNLTGGEGQQVRSLEGFKVSSEKSDRGNILKFTENTTDTPLSLDALGNYKFLIVGKKIELSSSTSSSTLDFTGVGDKVPVVEVKIKNSSSAAPTLIKLKMLNENAVMNFPKGNGEGQVTVKADFEIQDGQVVLVSGDQKLPLQQTPPSFYNGIEKALQAKETKIQDVNLKLEDGQPVYEIKTEAKGKLLGLIPINLASVVNISGTDNSIKNVKNPWYSFLVVKQDLGNIKLVPDFAITNVEFPSNYKQGEKVTVKITLTNVGTAFGLTHYDIFHGSCTSVAYYWGDQQIYWTCLPAALGPGDSFVYDDYFTGVCDKFKVSFDPNHSIEEDPDLSNNTMTVQGNCSQ